MKIWPNVYWLDGRSSNMYLVVEEDGLTLIDTGMPKRQGLVLDTLRELGHQPAELTRILITHGDMDHAGSAAAIQAQTGATIYASQATATWLEKGSSPPHMPQPVQFIMDRLVRYPMVPGAAMKIIQDQDVLPVLGGLQVLATAGHTPDHHAFYSPSSGVLFAGDALRTLGGRLGSSPDRITWNPDAARRSAIQLLSLAPALVACGHGKPMSQHSSDDLMDLFNELRQS